MNLSTNKIKLYLIQPERIVAIQQIAIHDFHEI